MVTCLSPSRRRTLRRARLQAPSGRSQGGMLADGVPPYLFQSTSRLTILRDLLESLRESGPLTVGNLKGGVGFHVDDFGFTSAVKGIWIVHSLFTREGL